MSAEIHFFFNAQHAKIYRYDNSKHLSRFRTLDKTKLLPYIFMVYSKFTSDIYLYGINLYVRKLTLFIYLKTVFGIFSQKNMIELKFDKLLLFRTY